MNTDEKLSFEYSSSTHIHSLPDHVLLDIFAKLDFVDLCLCSRVCHHWHKLSKDFSLRKTITITKSLQANQFENLISAIVHRRYCNLEKFQLLEPEMPDSLLYVKKNSLWRLTNLSSKLKKLALNSCSLTSVSVQDLSSNLLHLSVRGSEVCPLEFFGLLPNIHLPHITCLDVGGVNSFLGRQDLDMLNTLKSLRALYLDECYRIDDDSIDTLRDILPQLEILDVEQTMISNKGLWTILNHGSKLRDLYIGYTRATDIAFSRVRRNAAPRLSYLCIRNTNISSLGLHTFIKYHTTRLFLNTELGVCCTCFYTLILVDDLFSEKSCHHYLHRSCCCKKKLSYEKENKCISH